MFSDFHSRDFKILCFRLKVIKIALKVIEFPLKVGETCTEREPRQTTLADTLVAITGCIRSSSFRARAAPGRRS